MSMSAMIQAMGAAAGGVSSGLDAAEAAAERKRLREEAAEDRRYLMTERARALQMRTDIGREAAPGRITEIKQDRPETMDNRDVGQPGEAPLPTAGYDVGGKRFADQPAAAAAKAEYDAPQAVTARMSDVLMRNGDPVGAQKLRTGAMEEQATQFKLNDAMRADIDGKFNHELSQVQVGDWDGLAKVFGSVHGVKFAPVTSADGKSIEVNRVGPDGALVPTGRMFQNNDAGFESAAAGLLKLPPEKKLNYIHQKAVLVQQAERDAANAKHQEGMLGVAQQNANTNEQYRRDQAAALQAKASPAKAVLESFDEKLARETAHDAVKAENKRRGDANQPLLSGEEAATLADSYVGAQRSKHNNNLVIAAAANDLSGVDPASPDYAASYNRALSFGDPKQIAAQLKARGFEAPRGPMSKAEMISRDMVATGVKDAIVDINGTRRAYGNAKMSDAVSRRSAGPAPTAPVATMTDMVGANVEAPEGAALDNARAARVQAQQELAKFSLVTRQRNPQGFAAAQAALAQAQAAEAKAQQAWQATVGQQDRAFTRMSQVAGR